MAASLGVLSAALFAGLGRIDSLGARIDAVGARLDGRIDSLGLRIDAQGEHLGNRIDALGDQIHRLDVRLTRAGG